MTVEAKYFINKYFKMFTCFSFKDPISRIKQSATKKKGRGFEGKCEI